MAGPLAQRFEAQPLASAGGRVITSPFQFVTTGEDHLRVLSFNSAAGVRLKIRGRVVPVAGPIEPLERDHVPNTDRSVVSSVIPLQAGAVLNLTVFASSGAPLVGQTYVMVQLIRGLGAAAIVLGTLLAGYVTAQQHLAWPGSPIESSTAGEPAVRTVSGTVPAAGAEFSEIVPTGARWEVLGLTAQLVASAAPGARVPALQFMTPFSIIAASPLTSAINAGGAQVITWAQGVPIAAAPGVTRWAAPLPFSNRLLAQQTLQSLTVNLDVGDQWTAPVYTVREWLEVN